MQFSLCAFVLTFVRDGFLLAEQSNICEAYHPVGQSHEQRLQ